MTFSITKKENTYENNVDDGGEVIELQNSDEMPRILVSKERDCEAMGIDRVPLFICAPMVRYSKLPFRKLVRHYGCDLAYSPMMYANCFVRSEKCRAADFVTGEGDRPLIVQFAANCPEDFAAAAELVYGQCQGVDLNCGCPKRDTTARGCGSRLLKDPELIADIVRQCRGRIPESDPEKFSISVKIRLQKTLTETIDLCKKVEAAGVSHIAVHGRTPEQRAEPPDYDAIAQVKASLRIPVYANGDCKSYRDALEITKRTGVDGVMAANGLLANPAMFAGHSSTPKQCIRDWVEIWSGEEREPEGKWGDHYPFDLFHRQLQFMTRALLRKPQRMALTDADNFSVALDVLRETGLF